MTPSIDIDEQVFEKLQSEAEALIDTPNSVLRRLLGVDANGSRRSKRTDASASPSDATRRDLTRTSRPGRGEILPEAEYELPILRYLAEHDGRAPSREVVRAVGETLRDKLTDLDMEPLRSGDIRWENRAAFVRLRLVEKEELVKGSPRGTWEITAKGQARVESEG